jgi:hypothetical protein
LSIHYVCSEYVSSHCLHGLRIHLQLLLDSARNHEDRRIALCPVIVGRVSLRVDFDLVVPQSVMRSLAVRGMRRAWSVSLRDGWER